MAEDQDRAYGTLRCRCRADRADKLYVTNANLKVIIEALKDQLRANGIVPATLSDASSSGSTSPLAPVAATLPAPSPPSSPVASTAGSKSVRFTAVAK